MTLFIGTVKQNYKDELISIVHKYIPGCTIILFGSRATGKHRPGSDIDLALDNKSKISWDAITKILIEIDETTIPMSVDIVDLYSADAEFKKQVLQEGIVWTF